MRSVVVALVCALIGAWLALAVRTKVESARGRERNLRGKRGERDAERLLQARGYHIQERQTRASYEIEVDGKKQPVALVFDFVVVRDGERFVAEVKTGDSPDRLAQPDVRRQLLEYQIATGSRRVLLVDPERETVTEVSFFVPLPGGQAQGGHALVWVALLVLIALAIWRFR